MRFNLGDIVIKTTGGNRMTIYSQVDSNKYLCSWFVGNKFFSDTFLENELVTTAEYRKILIREERTDKIKSIIY
jgi:uncharacterized protein YodC (DUF2158 family)